MKEVDYIIVGCGLAGLAFCEQLRSHKNSFLIFDDVHQPSSTMEAGMYNPVVLKRFTAAWKAKELLQIALPKYKALEEFLNVKFIHSIPVYRKFASVEEQNLWFSATDKKALESFLSTNIVQNPFPQIKAPYGFGEVLQTGRIETGKLINHYHKYLEKQDLLFNEPFDYEKLLVHDDKVEYKDVTAKHIVFSEGCGMSKNPYFNKLPLNPLKGEIIIIHAPDLKIDVIIKSSVFIAPVEGDIYAVGATYNWTDKTNTPTEKGKEELINKLKSIIDCDFEVVGHVAGLRPTVIDRRPLVGVHPKHKKLYVLNGLGTRGIMGAPYIAEQLYNFIEHKTSLDRDIDIKRFSS